MQSTNVTNGKTPNFFKPRRSEADREKVAQHWAKGTGPCEIARVLNMPPGTVYGILDSLGLRQAKWRKKKRAANKNYTPELLAEFRELRAAGWDNGRIQRKLRLTPKQFYYIRNLSKASRAERPTRPVTRKAGSCASLAETVKNVFLDKLAECRTVGDIQQLVSELAEFVK